MGSFCAARRKASLAIAYGTPSASKRIRPADTTFREVPNHDIIPPQMVDVNMQVAEIIHDGLSPKELAQIYRSALIGMTFRVDAKKKELLQVTNFFYLCDEPFWANFSPVLPSYFAIIRLGTSNSRIFESTFVFCLRVMIHKWPSKNVCRLFLVKFLISE